MYPVSTRIVLRDRTRSDALTVLLLALDELVEAGTWTRDQRRERLVRRVELLRPAGAPPPTEPHRGLDAILRERMRERELELRGFGRWLAGDGHAAPSKLAAATVEWLVQTGMLVTEPTAAGGRRLGPSTRAKNLLAHTPPKDAKPRPRLSGGGRKLSELLDGDRPGRIVGDAYNEAPFDPGSPRTGPSNPAVYYGGGS